MYAAAATAAAAAAAAAAAEAEAEAAHRQTSGSGRSINRFPTSRYFAKQEHEESMFQAKGHFQAPPPKKINK